MIVTEWSYFDNGKPTISNWMSLNEPNINYEEARQAVIQNIRENNYHFTGNYHQNGETGAPIIDGKYSFEVSQREWGDIMAESWPDEDYGDREEEWRYLKWAWVCDDKWKIP